MLFVAAEHHAELLGTDLGSWGALLAGFGGLLLLYAAVSDKAGINGMTFSGTLPRPAGRFESGVEVVGAASVAVGSVLLLIAASHLSILAVVTLIVAASIMTYAVMAYRLRAHLSVMAEGKPDAGKSFLWCCAHPRWSPPD